MIGKKVFGGIALGICILCIAGIFWSVPIVIEKHYDMAIPPEFENHEDKLVLSYQLETYRNDIRAEYRAYQDAMDKKFNALIGILAVVVTVWIALNIYNFIEKREFEELKTEYRLLKGQADSIRTDIENLRKDIEHIKEGPANLIENLRKLSEEK